MLKGSTKKNRTLTISPPSPLYYIYSFQCTSLFIDPFSLASSFVQSKVSSIHFCCLIENIHQNYFMLRFCLKIMAVVMICMQFLLMQFELKSNGSGLQCQYQEKPADSCDFSVKSLYISPFQIFQFCLMTAPENLFRSRVCSVGRKMFFTEN